MYYDKPQRIFLFFPQKKKKLLIKNCVIRNLTNDRVKIQRSQARILRKTQESSSQISETWLFFLNGYRKRVNKPRPAYIPLFVLR